MKLSRILVASFLSPRRASRGYFQPRTTTTMTPFLGRLTARSKRLSHLAVSVTTKSVTAKDAAMHEPAASPPIAPPLCEDDRLLRRRRPPPPPPRRRSCLSATSALFCHLRGGAGGYSSPSPFDNDKRAFVSASAAALAGSLTAVRNIFLALVALVLVSFLLFLATSRGFRRSVKFWTSVAPMILEYKLLKFKSRRRRRRLFDKNDLDLGKESYDGGGISMPTNGADSTPFLTEQRKRHKTSTTKDQALADYHRRVAPKLVGLVIELAGIYIKIGQFLSTVGAGLMDDTYVAAMRPLQDGIPPRPFSEISGIVERSLGRPLDEVFYNFDERPIGAASIAQAHRAVLMLDGGSTTEVIVKVQYPDVAEQFEADFHNLRVATRWLNPDNLDSVEMLRRRHCRELDFRTEARHLRECRTNLRRRGLEPSLVRIPKVFGRDADAVFGSTTAAAGNPSLLGDDDNDGKDDNNDGEDDEDAVDFNTTQHVLVMEYLPGISLADAIHAEQEDMARALGLPDAEALRKQVMDHLKEHFVQGGGEAGEDVGGATDHMSSSSKTTGADAMKTASLVVPLVRSYASLRNGMNRTAMQVRDLGSRTLSWITRQPQPQNLLSVDDITAPVAARRRHKKINLGRAIKTLIYVHGVQVILDGTYNADPHPGNVLVMEDGRLGLIDYGMVGRLSDQDRQRIASTVLALAKGDRETVVREYRESGYRATWMGGADHSDDVYYRFAAIHLDRIDLSPVVVPHDGSGGDDGDEDGRVIDFVPLLKKTMEWSVPDWIEQVRRIGGLLIGVGSQAGRPISLAREWKPVAQQYLEDSGKGRKRKKADTASL